MTHAVFRLVEVLLLGAVIALAATPSAHAQQPAGLTINQLEAGRYPDLSAIVTVQDTNGVPVPGLGLQQFQAFDGNQPLPIASVQAAQDSSLPLSVVLAIDVSGSMTGNPLDEAKQAATQFVQQLGPNDQGAIVVFSGQVSTVVPFTNDRSRLTNGFANLTASGNTALYEAVQASVFAARSANAARRAVVLLTDGKNDTPDTTATSDGSLAVAKGAGVPVFTVGFGDQPDAQYLQTLSSTTSGEYLPATVANVGAVYQSIAALLRSQYVISLTAQLPADGKQASLRLVANVAGTPVEATANFQRGFAPAPPAATSRPATAPSAKTEPAGSSHTALYVFSTVVLLALAAASAYMLTSWRRRRRILAHQLATTELNPVRAAAQPLPRPAGTSIGPDRVPAGSGRLIEKSPDGDRTHLLGAGPAVIGSARNVCTIILPESEDVAPEHVRIWLQDGRYLLHHAGGARRRTLVNGREADWVRLEDGDELQVGGHRFICSAP